METLQLLVASLEMIGSEGTSFRREIVQLRAIAVLSVLLFHLKVPGFQGGFVGVDVFFVISGYLITRNILVDDAGGRFSFSAFYLRRTRRIYPALIFTVLMTYLSGALWTAPLLFLDIAKECTHALLSIANIQYWREASHYFAAKSDELALLHCWSLSLEEQFYLIWPALLIAAARVGCIRSAIVLLSLASFLATIWVGPIDSSAVFFLMPFRMFEFGCGALVLFAGQTPRRQSVRELLSAAGFAVILSSALLLQPDTSRQELLVVIPCLGAAAVIWTGDTTFVSRALRSQALTAIGTISYSLYLCHWPIIFYSRFIFGEAADTAGGNIVMLVTMLFVATSMYYFVERRFIVAGGAASGAPLKTLMKFSAAILAFAILTHATFILKGFAWRVPESVLADGRLDSSPTTDQVVWPPGLPIVDLAGDSHAEMYVAAMLPLVESLGGNLQYIGTAGCPIVKGAAIRSRRRVDCLRGRDEQIAQLETQTRPLIFIQRWETYDDAGIDYDQPGMWPNDAGSFAKLEAALSETLRVLTPVRRVMIVGAQVPAGCEINRPRLLQGPLPHVPPPPCSPMSKVNAVAAGAAINAMLARVQSKYPGRVDLLKPVDYLCYQTCPTYHAGHWLYWDATHFTLAGSTFMTDRAASTFRTFILGRSNAMSSGAPTEN
ncbi:acyltransferase [Bradyrhizobium sp. MOS001]|uniref:acyltransferase family protein n=1 Tax=unclassified Bradyrhizobium TaxID=2631580 RepID=UPI00107533E8|nr:acyltransferase family protein [Bradyrhizobium sp. MOS001]TFW59581.1 acyltransferase [Bradyrhizobium sp. MOS001]